MNSNYLEQMKIPWQLLISSLLLTCISSFLYGQGSCQGLAFSITGLEPCRYRASASVTMDCYDEINVLVPEGAFYEVVANEAAGWIVELVGPDQLLVTHTDVTFPNSNSWFVEFAWTAGPGMPGELIFLYPDKCVFESCESLHNLAGCPSGGLSGTVYRECDMQLLDNQCWWPDAVVQLWDEFGLLLDEQVTDENGHYAIPDLLPGAYVLRLMEMAKKEVNLPKESEYIVQLSPGGSEVRDFGVCPVCDCDDWELALVPEPGNGDTAYLNILLINNNSFCYSELNIALDSGQIVGIEVLEGEWEGVILDDLHAEFHQTSFECVEFNLTIMRIAIVFGIKEQGIKALVLLTGEGNQAPEPGCQDSIIIEHPSKFKEVTCCPEGYIAGPELVIDGHFVGPNLPATDYTPWVSGSFGPGHVAIFDQSGSYAVNNNWMRPGLTYLGDTYLTLDGHTQPNRAAWKQQVAGILPDQEFYFCAMASNMVRTSLDHSDPVIVLEIIDDNNPANSWASTPLAIPENPKTWVPFTLPWTAPSNPSSSYTLRIRSTSQVGTGNDFALDNVSFRTCTQSPKDSCCEDLEAFCDDLEKGIVFSADSCKVTMDLSKLPPCYTIEWVDWGNGPEYGPWTPSTFPYPMHTFSGNGTYPISYLAIAYNDSNFICLEKVMMDTITVQCEPCICNNPAMYLVQNGISYQVFCNKVGPLMQLPCPVGDVIISGFFGCETESGELCEETVVNYIFTGPNGTIDMGSTTPFSSFIYPASMIGDPGSYYLTLSTLCPGQADSCVCTVKWLQEACDTCYCSGFTDMYIRTHTGAMNEPVWCNDIPVVLQCPPKGLGFHLTGVFGCAGGACPPDHQIDWSLMHHPSGTTHSGSFQDNDPFFGIHILPTYISQPGLYTLTMAGVCNGDTCVCEVQFIIDCPDLCPCDIEDILTLSANVDKGFAVALANKSCKACFSPLAVSDCETVEWYVNSLSGTPIGTSKGSQTFCYTFPFSGTYTIFMVVTRLKPDGTLCEVFVKSQIANVSCIKYPDCVDAKLPNSSFSENPVGGGLGEGENGEAPGWAAAKDNPILVEGIPESHDAWSVLLTGCYFNSDILESAEPICLAKAEGGMISMRLKTPADPIPGADMKVGRRPPGNRLILDVSDIAKKEEPCDHKKCFRLAEVADLLPLDEDEWYDVFIPYDLQNWDSSQSCGVGDKGTPAYLSVWITNMLSDDQGSGIVRDGILIDNICLDGTVVSVKTSNHSEAIRLYPNPTHGEFRIELPHQSLMGTRVRVIGLTGVTILDQLIPEGRLYHTVDTATLAPGMYFVEVLLQGQRQTVFKVVKQ